MRLLDGRKCNCYREFYLIRSVSTESCVDLMDVSEIVTVHFTEYTV